LCDLGTLLRDLWTVLCDLGTLLRDLWTVLHN